MRASLRGQLLAWLLIPLGVLTAIDVVDDYLDAQRTAGIVFDRLLLVSARTIAQAIRVESGAARVVVPRGTLEAFAWPAPDLVYYRVSAPDGALLAGTADLPALSDAVDPDAPEYRTSDFRGEPLRAVAFVQEVSGPGGGPVRVEVAATLRGRAALAHELWIRNARQQAVILVLAALLAWIGLTRGLTPLLRLGRAVTTRNPESLEPIGTGAVQSELRPLVAAINQYMSRLDARMAAQRRFIANASHQLRTPLTLLNTQVHFALATSDVAAKDEALQALRDGIRHSNRIANQLLTLSRAEPESGFPARLTPVDLHEVARMALEKIAGLAERRHIDLGFDSCSGDGDDAPATVYGDEVLVLEMIVNLVDNAVRYTPPGGQVTVATERMNGAWRLTVSDTGPGIPAPERERVFERFYRVVGNEGEGSGLGLSIVQEIARACHASVALDEGRDGRGLVVSVTFPAHKPGVVAPSPQGATAVAHVLA
jgi:two-component system, OmpR family, sensor histidine kinase TctE